MLACFPAVALHWRRPVGVTARGDSHSTAPVLAVNLPFPLRPFFTRTVTYTPASQNSSFSIHQLLFMRSESHGGL